jgi:hypothetical protein
VVTTVDEHVDIIGDIFKLSINDPEGAVVDKFKPILAKLKPSGLASRYVG